MKFLIEHRLSESNWPGDSRAGREARAVISFKRFHAVFFFFFNSIFITQKLNCTLCAPVLPIFIGGDAAINFAQSFTILISVAAQRVINTSTFNVIRFKWLIIFCILRVNLHTSIVRTGHHHRHRYCIQILICLRKRYSRLQCTAKIKWKLIAHVCGYGRGCYAQIKRLYKNDRECCRFARKIF